VWKRLLQSVPSSQVWKSVFQVVESFNDEVRKVCGREFFELLKVSTFKFEVCAREVFQVLESFNFVCQREFFANVISFKSNFRFVQESFSNVCGFLVKGLFCDI
jgi:hypothetical protein